MAGKIFVTGDCHREFIKFSKKSFPVQNELDKDDYMIICGDFGGIWDESETREEKWWLDWLDSLSFTVLFVDGNHENFDRLNAYPVSQWCGGKVHKIRESVIHLMRGQVYELHGHTIFTMGGASSHDISGGILDKDAPDFKERKKELDAGWEPYRIKHISWWEEELPNEEEYEEARRNLEKYEYKVDYIISHCCATGTQDILAGKGLFVNDSLNRFFEGIKNKCTFKKWYFGHYHDNINVSEHEVLLYDKIVDAWGTFEQADEPSYDIEVKMPDGNVYLVKHVEESAIMDVMV